MQNSDNVVAPAIIGGCADGQPLWICSKDDTSIAKSLEHRRFKRGAASIGARFRGSGTSYNGFSENVLVGREDFLGDGTDAPSS